MASAECTTLILNDQTFFWSLNVSEVVGLKTQQSRLRRNWTVPIRRGGSALANPKTGFIKTCKMSYNTLRKTIIRYNIVNIKHVFFSFVVWISFSQNKHINLQEERRTTLKCNFFLEHSHDDQENRISFWCQQVYRPAVNATLKQHLSFTRALYVGMFVLQASSKKQEEWGLPAAEGEIKI